MAALEITTDIGGGGSAQASPISTGIGGGGHCAGLSCVVNVRTISPLCLNPQIGAYSNLAAGTEAMGHTEQLRG